MREITARGLTVFNVADGRCKEPEMSDLVVITFRTGKGDYMYALDRRATGKLIEGLQLCSTKLTAPKIEK